jgi:hypothetical protein
MAKGGRVERDRDQAREFVRPWGQDIRGGCDRAAHLQPLRQISTPTDTQDYTVQYISLAQAATNAAANYAAVSGPGEMFAVKSTVSEKIGCLSHGQDRDVSQIRQ